MPDKKDSKITANTAKNVTKVVGLNESKVPDFKFTPPPPKVKTDKK